MTERINNRSEETQSLWTAQKEMTERFFGVHEIKIPAIPLPPDELFEFIETTKSIGFEFEPYYEPKYRFTQHEDLPGWTHKPPASLWKSSYANAIGMQVFELQGRWVAIEAIERPDYISFDTGEIKSYPDDPLGKIISDLHDSDLISHSCFKSDYSKNTRFGIPAFQVVNDIQPTFASLAGVDKGQVNFPSYLFWNYVGNCAHPEWGSVKSLEYFDDNLSGLTRLVGGSSDWGGLSGVGWGANDEGVANVSFRLCVSFRSNPE